MADNQTKIKSAKESDKTPASKYQRWKEEVSKAEKELESFRDKGQKVVKRFLDDRDGLEGAERKFNIFTANVGIMQSSLYAKIPKVTVDRRFGQMNDDPARVASLMLQNCVMQDMEENECDFDQVMRDGVEDRLIPGMGSAWLRLVTETEEKEIEEQLDPLTGQVLQEAATYEEISRQEVAIDHVHWTDFLYSPCRTWKERRWVGRRVYMDKDALIERFGDELAGKIPLDYKPDSARDNNANTPENEVLQKAIIYELWDRVEKRVLWLSKGYPELLDEVDDPLELEDFDPCPKPLFATMSTSNCVPVSDYVIYQDQYDELDQVNNRISLLVAACKVVGVYDAGSKGVQKMLQEGVENQLVPVDNWAMFSEKGGIKGQVDWLPLDVIVAALERLRQARDDIKGQIYELTGISDIVRGDTKASETLGAQNIKAQFASVRIQRLQDEVARFAQGILRIKAEIICKHFTEEQIVLLSNMQYYPDFQNQELMVAAMELLKSEDYCWRVNVQADSLGQTDYASQKQEKVEFTNAVATFLQSASTTIKAMPPSAPIVFETLKFAVSGFKGAKELEGIIDQGLQKITAEMEQAKAKAENQPNPEQQKMQMEMQMAQQKAQLDAQTKQQDMQIKQQTAHNEMQLAQQKNIQELQMQQQEFELKMAQMQQEFNLKMQQSQAESELKLQTASQEQAFAEDKARRDSLEQEIQRNADREHETKTRDEDRAFQEKLHKEKLAQASKPKTATTASGKKVTVE